MARSRHTPIIQIVMGLLLGFFPACAPVAQVLKTGQTTSFGPGSDGGLQKGVSRSFTDNGDGTITDNRTGLMWEKKDRSGGINDGTIPTSEMEVVARELKEQRTTHGASYINTYTWCKVLGTKCEHQGDSMNGSMVTTFLAALNDGAGFAGHTDWRIPNVRELQTIVDYENWNPAVDTVFNVHCEPGCTVLTCSCTQPSLYWSSTTCRKLPDQAWAVYFGNGGLDIMAKDKELYVRAVRGGR